MLASPTRLDSVAEEILVPLTTTTELIWVLNPTDSGRSEAQTTEASIRIKVSKESPKEKLKIKKIVPRKTVIIGGPSFVGQGLSK